MYKKELRIINTRSAKAEDFPASIELVTSGAVRMDRLITHRFLLTDLNEAMRLVESDGDQRMKISSRTANGVPALHCCASSQ